jgi:hypothetical protein
VRDPLASDARGTRKALHLFGPNRPVGVELGRGFIDYKPILIAKKAGLVHAFAEQEAPYTRFMERGPEAREWMGRQPVSEGAALSAMATLTELLPQHNGQTPSAVSAKGMLI